MDRHEQIRQPEKVSNPVAKYLEMTAPRSRAPQRRSQWRDEQSRTTRPPIDNCGLSLEEGNDFA